MAPSQWHPTMAFSNGSSNATLAWHPPPCLTPAMAPQQWRRAKAPSNGTHSYSHSTYSYSHGTHKDTMIACCWKQEPLSLSGEPYKTMECKRISEIPRNFIQTALSIIICEHITYIIDSQHIYRLFNFQ